MSRSQISFFATRHDLVDLLVPMSFEVPFVLSQLIDNQVKVYQSIDDISNFSISEYGDQNRDTRYMLIEPDSHPITRKVEQRKGGFNIFYDQQSFPASVVLKSGGEHVESNSLISGFVGTVSNEAWSKEMYGQLSASIKKKFTKIKAFYVGENAHSKLCEGWRLTASARSPKDYDLTLD